MKIYLYNDSATKLTAHHRPFTFDSTITTNVNESDNILIKPSDYVSFLNDSTMTPYHHKTVLYANDDNPNYLLKENKIKKLIAQPLQKQNELDKFNAMTIPLIMTDHLDIHLDSSFLMECRNQEKIYDYYFVGQFYGKRNNLLTLNENNSIIKQTGSIYNLSKEEKQRSIKSFLLELSKSKFGFAPRGIGSNSFRLYECLMVGTIPISTDVIEYPFINEVDWNDFSIRGSLDDIDSLINKSKNIDYTSYREKGINFWEDYVKMDKCFNKIGRLL